MNFTIIHASYGRPDLALITMRRWLDASSGENNIEYLLSIDKADSSEYPDVITMPHVHAVVDVIRNNINTSVAAINNAASKSTGEILIVVSDDFEPLHNWDVEILKVVGDRSDWMLKTWDGTQPWIITLPILDRTYYNRFGYVYHPKYTHMFCDTELTAVADMLGKKIDSQLEFMHKHYSVRGGIQKDKTSIKADATWNHGEALFVKRASENFGVENPLPCEELKEALKWIENKNRKK